MIITTKKELPKRREYDYYDTPMEFVIAGLNQLPEDFKPQRILDAGCGAGVWGSYAKQRFPEATLVGVDLREVMQHPAYDRLIIGDFLTLDHPIDQPYDAVIGNPPYKYTEQFLDRSWTLLADGGYLVYILPLRFMESRRRHRGLFATRPPVLVNVCANRPSWDGKGTNATAYAFYLWRKGHTGDTLLRTIEVGITTRRMF